MKYTANTPTVNWITRWRGCSPVARYRAGTIVDGFSESARPIDTASPISLIIGAAFSPLRVNQV